MNDTRLEEQIRFIVEIDKLKTIFRRTSVMGTDRLENDAEHSWHIALMAVLLSEYAEDGTDVLRAVKMVLIHDIVEIDAGDTFLYDEKGRETKRQRETEAADRLFGMLPDDQAEDLRELWEEFEAEVTPEARYAAAVDRLQPMLSNFYTEGAAWREHSITHGMTFNANKKIARGAPELWRFAKRLLEEAVEKGYLAPDDT